VTLKPGLYGQVLESLQWEFFHRVPFNRGVDRARLSKTFQTWRHAKMSLTKILQNPMEPTYTATQRETRYGDVIPLLIPNRTGWPRNNYGVTPDSLWEIAIVRNCTHATVDFQRVAHTTYRGWYSLLIDFASFASISIISVCVNTTYKHTSMVHVTKVRHSSKKIIDGMC